MSPRRSAELAVHPVDAPQVPPPPRLRLLVILWPAFLMAGVLEMLIFAVVDPRSLHWFGASPIEWSPSAVYSVTFLILWLVIAASTALTLLLQAVQREP